MILSPTIVRKSPGKIIQPPLIYSEDCGNGSAIAL